MRRKRIWYSIEVPDMWWSRKSKRFVELDDPRFVNDSKIRIRIVSNAKQVDRALRACPSGTLVTRFAIVFNKGRHRDVVLRSWAKP